MSKGDDQVWIAQNLGRSTGAQGMSTIDEIMGAVGRHGDDCIRDGDTASESFEALRELIAAALTEARREGAEAMKNACAQEAIISAPTDSSAQQIADNIRALPLPTGQRQAVLLVDHMTDAHADAVLRAAGSALGNYTMQATRDGLRQAVRAIESAVLAANNLGVSRG